MSPRRGMLPPLLRTPPFPGTRFPAAAVSTPGAPARIDLSPARVARVFALVRETDVAGAFWRRPDRWTAPAQAHGDDDAVALATIGGTTLRVTRPGRWGTPGGGPDGAAVARHLLAETRYRDPFTGAEITAEQAIALLAGWRQLVEANRAIAAAMGMAWWKRRQIRAFLWSGRPLRFRRGDAAAVRLAARAGGAIAAWPSRVGPALAARAAAAGVPLMRVEDGFIRSVGLGSGLHPPFSITVDPLGIHYDPAGPSALEQLLATATFDAALLARAARLRETVVTRGIGKYGAGRDADLPVAPPGRRLVLVPGQVSDDLSVLRGGGGIVGNADLLARVRALEPEAEIWFRPHPDVDAGHRRGAMPDHEALAHADRVVRGGSMAALLDRVDAVHVLTSLAGFEALLRGREVVAHGQPFFAGWGLTRDVAGPSPRRTRRLALDELVAGTLILFPRYLDPVTGLPCPVEVLVDRLGAQPRPRLGPVTLLRSLQGRFSRRGR